MKTTRTVLILMVLDLMAFFSILKIVDSNNMLWAIEVVLAVGIIPLLYSAIGNISKAILVQAEDFVKLREEEKREIDIKFNEVIKQNENFKEAIVDAFKNLNDNQNSICEKISSLQSESIKCIQSLANSSENMNGSITKLFDDTRKNVDLRFDEFIKQNENLKGEIITAFKNLNDNQNSAYENTRSLQSETIKSIQALANSSENMYENTTKLFEHTRKNIDLRFDEFIKSVQALADNDENMNKNINELLIKEQEFINVTFNNSNTLKESYENLNRFFTNSSDEFKENFAENYSQLNKLLEDKLNRISTKVTSSIEKTNDFLNDFSNLYTKFTDELKENEIRNFEQMKEITSGKIEEMQQNLIDNNLKSQENISEMALLFDNTLNSFEEKTSETIENYTHQLSKDIGKGIKDIHKKLVEDNGEWKRITEEYSDKNTEVINQIHELIQKMSNLHNNLLKQIDENQKKMMHLNESDIKLMKDMMK